MKKNKYTIVPISFSIISFIILLTSLLSGYFVSKNEIFKEIDGIYTQICNVIEEEGYTKLDKYIDEKTRITLIDIDTKNCVFDNKDSENIDGDFYSFESLKNKKSIEFSGYFNQNVASKIYLNTFSTSLIRVQVKLNFSFNALYYSTIIVPSVYLLFCVIFVLISTYFYKKSLDPLKHQIKKFYTIVTKDNDEKIENNPLSLSQSIRKIRKNIEVVLQENEKFQSQINFILDSIEQGLIVINSDNKIIMFNKKSSQIFNISKEDTIDKLYTIIDNIEILKLIKIVQRTMQNTSNYINIGNKVFDVEVSLLSLNWTKKDEKPGLSIFLIDVTDEYNSRKMKEEFFANVAHEIKSPLTTIIGYQEMIRDEIITTKEEISEANEVTIKEANRLKSILNNMLGISSIERNELRPIVKINLKDGINNIIESERLKLKLKNIIVYIDIEPYIVKMNEQDFDILFRNLIENAIKYNKNNGEIYIDFNIKEKKLSIKDTGIGISKEHINRIFERFYRINKARSLKDGTGLGLALVKHTCKYYNFEINVDSRENIGTTFTIYLK